MRILAHTGFGIGDADQFEKFPGTAPSPRLCHSQMMPQNLRDLAPHVEHRIERSHRILEDHRQFPSADLPCIASAGNSQNRLAFPADVAGSNFARHVHQAHGRLDGYALP